jgi:poly-gamma-glutamate synthesis protein (capsule biosynthesis protein)
LVLAACGAPHDPPHVVAPIAVAPAPLPVRYGCGAGVPAAACAAFRAQVETWPHAVWADSGAPVSLSRCAPGAADPAGAWTYALVAPSLSPIENVSIEQLAAMWSGKAKITLAASAETAAALDGGEHVDPGAHPALDATHWAVLPADELTAAWHVVAIGGHHPLEADAAASPLTVPLCAHTPQPVNIRNVDPDQLTVVAMTGTTAMTRFMSGLLDRKGTTYPARDIAPWFTGADFVHVSNEVSFVPGCDQKIASIEPQRHSAPLPAGNKPPPSMGFCSRENYIELLEAIHANVIELDGSHLADYGYKWIPHTLDMYAQRGWHWFGGGHDQLEAQRPLELEHHGNRFAFLGCNMPKTTSHIVWNVPGVAACDLRRMAWQVAELRARGVFPIVSIQHEEVYVHDPPDVIVHDFRHLAAVGAGVVFGSQAHCAHPWEMDHNAYVHYGAGNFFFDQEGANTRDGAADRLYLYRGRLLAVGHLYTRLEENGRPRPLSDAERAGFLATMGEALGKLPKAKPWADAQPVALGPLRPDSFLVGNMLQQLYVFAPATSTLTATATSPKYPLVLDLHGGALRGGPLERLLAHNLPAQLVADPASQHAYVAAPHLAAGASWTPARIAAITAFMEAKYPIDPAQVTVRRD